MKKIKEDMNVVDKDIEKRVRNKVIVSWFRIIKVFLVFPVDATMIHNYAFWGQLHYRTLFSTHLATRFCDILLYIEKKMPHCTAFWYNFQSKGNK